MVFSCLSLPNLIFTKLPCEPFIGLRPLDSTVSINHTNGDWDFGRSLSLKYLQTETRFWPLASTDSINFNQRTLGLRPLAGDVSKRDYIKRDWLVI